MIDFDMNENKESTIDDDGYYYYYGKVNENENEMFFDGKNDMMGKENGIFHS